MIDIKKLILTGRKGLSKFVNFLLVGNGEGVQVFAASNLEFGNSLRFLDSDLLSVLSSSSDQKILNFLDLFWLISNYNLQKNPTIPF